MEKTARLFCELLVQALEHPEGAATARAFDRTLQFDLSDGASFYVEIKNGKIRYAQGDSGLDWKYRDWKRASCVHTSSRLLEGVVSGKRIISDAFFDHAIGFAPRRLADPETSAGAIVAWFYTLVRLGLEEAQKKAWERHRASLFEGK
ncbi:MAG TPA: hypothetical protein VGL11_05655 [Candidatus Binatia bacterium]|jgi:hypothetical protein